MAKKKRNPHRRDYNQHLKRTNLPTQKPGSPTYAFEEEITKRKRNKFIIAGVIIVSAIMMISLILPYVGGNAGPWQPTGIRDEENQPESYDPSSLIANQAFNRKEKDYLLLVGTKVNLNSAQLYNGSSLASYYIDIDEAINKEIKTNKRVAKPTKPNEISTKDLMLLRIKNHKVILSIYGKAQVMKYLEKLK
jgi:hypothetical protein